MVMAFASSAFALHGAYNSTGASCAECHSVHDATGGTTQNLFIQAAGPYASAGATNTGGPGLTPAAGYTNSNTEHLCEYCHVYGGHVVPQVYGQGTDGGANAMAAHKIGATDIPNSSAVAGFLKGDGSGGLGCIDCHNALPHAAKSGKTWTNSKSTLQLADPDGKLQNMYTQADGIDLTPYGGQPANAFCARCHDKNMELNLGGTTHVLTTNTTMNTANYGSQTVAFGTSETCVKCHNVREFHAIQPVAGTVRQGAAGTAYTATTTGTAPFNTSNESTGTAFTNFGPGKGYPNVVSAEVADGVCLQCHMKSDASAGVGVSF
jgi:nitrate/TMAO reductase-like tetraheme cytochrome c subunit